MSAVYNKSKSRELLYELCFAQYGYIGYCLSREMEEEASAMLKDARKNAGELGELYNGRHDVLALQGALIGFRMVLGKFKAVYLGPKAFKLISTASESADIYFNCSLEMANMLFHTPAFLGGSKQDAIPHYEQAVSMLEKGLSPGEGSWLYINTVLMLASAYRELDEDDKACRIHKALLEYEPGADWIREEYVDLCGDQDP
jgi:tetratricopeptide (TPR) repeat protein